MGAVTAGAGALTAVTGAIDTFSNMRAKKRVANEIKNLKEVPLTNVAEGMQVSTLGSDLQKEEASRLAATQTSALQEGGTRALVAGLGRVTANNQDVNARIAADLDQQQQEINHIRAQDEGNIRGIKEQRQANKLAALSSQYNAANQGVAQGMANVVQGLGTAGNSISGMSKDAVPNTSSASSKINKKIRIDPTTGRKIYAV